MNGNTGTADDINQSVVRAVWIALTVSLIAALVWALIETSTGTAIMDALKSAGGVFIAVSMLGLTVVGVIYSVRAAVRR
jgi:hypothetical protein